MPTNPAALRSRRMITNALLELMTEKPLSRIAVGEICERAELTRPTFYNHYSSKEDVLKGVIDELFDQFVSSLDEESLSSTDNMVRAYFQFWQDRRELLGLFNDNNLFTLMGDRFAGYMDELYAIIPFRNEAITPEELSYHNAFLSSGMAGMLKHWARADMEPEADEVTVYVSHALAVLYAGSSTAHHAKEA